MKRSNGLKGKPSNHKKLYEDSTVVSMRLPKTYWESLQRAAEAKGCSRNSLVAGILGESLRSPEFVRLCQIAMGDLKP